MAASIYVYFYMIPVIQEYSGTNLMENQEQGKMVALHPVCSIRFMYEFSLKERERLNFVCFNVCFFFFFGELCLWSVS